MLRSAASKVMWVGRATVFLVGLAVIVALTVGVVSQASAQNRPAQNVFILGATNTVNAMSSLVGSVADSAMLLVDNNGGGPALDLQVEPGQAPMKVNSGAKVESLNADKLDGKDESAFLGKTEKAADADKVDDLDSTTLLPGGDLPHGRTVRGNYGMLDTASPSSNGHDLIAISFGYRLASLPTVQVIKKGATPPAECPGTASSPEANPGFLCVYETDAFNLAASAYPYFENRTRNGVTLSAASKFNDTTAVQAFGTHGTWAVTGN